MTLAERDRKAIWHPFTPQKHMADPVAIVKAEGTNLIDDKGKYYIDAISSWWVNLHGHAHPYIAKRIYEQACLIEHVIFAGFTHEPAIELAERLLPLLPGPFSKIFYSDNGSTAVEVAIKMALQYWWNKDPYTQTSHYPKAKRYKILAFHNSYHGDTFGAMSASDRGVFTLPFHDKLFDVIFIDPAGTNASTAFAGISLHEAACFIYEPLLQGAGGMRMYDPAYLNELLRLCKRHGVICIADEVMTGFGRTGNLFASEYCDEKPDVICLSKGLTGGSMALGVTACTAEIYDVFVTDDTLKTFFHGHSFTANPLACTAALASLDLLQTPECSFRRAAIEQQHRQFLTKLCSESFAVATKNHRQLGTIIAFEVEIGTDEYLNTISSTITKKALELGLFIRPLGNTVYIMPPYCITREELNEVYRGIEEILRSL